MRGTARLHALAVLLATSAFVPQGSLAAESDIIVTREVPSRNAVEPAPPGPANTVRSEHSDLVIAGTSNMKLLDESSVGAVFATPMQTNPTSALQVDPALAAIDTPRGDMSPITPSYSSMSGLGSALTRDVGGAIGKGMGALNSAISASAGVGK